MQFNTYLWCRVDTTIMPTKLSYFVKLLAYSKKKFNIIISKNQALQIPYHSLAKFTIKIFHWQCDTTKAKRTKYFYFWKMKKVNKFPSNIHWCLCNSCNGWGGCSLSSVNRTSQSRVVFAFIMMGDLVALTITS